jgi:hypothetical protein
VTQEMVPLVQRLEQDVEGLEAYTSTAAGRGTPDVKCKLKAATGRINSVMAAVQRLTDAERLPPAEDDDDAQVSRRLPSIFPQLAHASQSALPSSVSGVSCRRASPAERSYDAR